MDQSLPLPKSERLVSLDVFRGLTIAGMILVNNPGSWDSVYPPLDHAPWDGWTPTDFIFPFFLFMVGVAMTFSFDKRLSRGASRKQLLQHVAARTIVLFLLGVILAGFPNFRLITPYILAIAGIQLTFAEPGRQKYRAGRSLAYIGWAAIVAAVAWFAIDFHYFNGLTHHGSFADLFPLHTDGTGTTIRIPGVLQRIALCYGAAAVILMFTRVRGRIAWVIFLAGIYWIIMKISHAPAGYVIGNGVKTAHTDAPPGAMFPGLFNDWLDVQLLGAHLYGSRPDPEGILSTLTAIATTLLGALTGTYLQRQQPGKAVKGAAMLVAGIIFLAAGVAIGHYFPINKKIWSSSYVVFMAGWALVFLSACYFIVDVLGFRKWAWPLLVLGTNAILAFFASGIAARLLSLIRWGEGDSATTLRGWTYHFFKNSIHKPENASLAWAICFVILWVVLISPLYHKKIFLKI